jgi:ribosomal-protein-alanine N-acetyltransferase
MGAMGSLLRRFRAVWSRREPAPPLDGPFHIRRMGPGDLRAVAAIEDASFAAPWRPDSYARAVADAHHNFFVAESDGRLVGYAGLWVEGSQAHIAKVAVRDGCRRQGIGSALLDHLLGHARRLGLTDAYLEVRRSNLGAQDLYRRFGFRFERVQPNAYANDGEDALVFVLRGLLEVKPPRIPEPELER